MFRPIRIASRIGNKGFAESPFTNHWSRQSIWVSTTHVVCFSFVLLCRVNCLLQKPENVQFGRDSFLFAVLVSRIRCLTVYDITSRTQTHFCNCIKCHSITIRILLSGQNRLSEGFCLREAIRISRIKFTM